MSTAGEVSLPLYADEDCNDYLEPSSRQVLRIAINLKTLIDRLIPTAIPGTMITSDSSIVLTDAAIEAVYKAAGGEGKGKGSSARRYQAPLVFCLLKVAGWYMDLAENELSNAALFESRLLATETIASILISRENNDKYLFLSMLCHRYSINLNDEDAAPENALELAVDMHVTGIICSAGYQRCMKWLWRGWIVQSNHDPSEYVLFKGTANTSFWHHFDPDRISTPYYQNIIEIIFSFVYLALFTWIVNTDTPQRILGLCETFYYLFTIGFAVDELVKFYHVGYNYFQFTNAFNDTMYALAISAMVVRISALTKTTAEKNNELNILAFRILSLVAPLMWTRMLLFLDVYQFVGTMIVVIKRMMKESLIFFFLLTVIVVGFLQAFLSLDQADGKRDLTKMILQWLLCTIMGGGDFDSTERFAKPYGDILYYSYTFVVVTILLNILVALYSTAYADVVDHATEEYLAGYSAKILKYVRAPDDKVFCPPFNLIEIILLEIPFSWWLPTIKYSKLCDKVMDVVYFPMLLWIANYESKEAKRIQYNRQMHVADDANEEDTEWDLEDGFNEDDEDGESLAESRHLQRRAERADPEFTKNFPDWKKSLEHLSPPIEKSKADNVLWEEYKIYEKLDKLTATVEALVVQNQELKKKLEN